MEQDRYTPTTYRAAEAGQVMGWIRAGQSGCLIGLRGAGKSNFLRFLLRQDVRQHYLGQDWADFAFVLVDLLALPECAEWAVYELMLDRLLHQLYPPSTARLSLQAEPQAEGSPKSGSGLRLGIGGETVQEIELLHQEVVRSRDTPTAQRAVERCVDVLCQRSAQRIVLLFDELDDVFRTLDPPLFRCLRAVRDAHKGQISYVIVVADDLACLRDDLAEVEHFYRLVSRNVCGLGPYSEAEARQMIRYLASQRSTELSEEDTAHLIKLSGGHAGLLKAALGLLWDAHWEGGLSELALALKDEPAIQAECQKVWDSLSESEQAALHALTAGAQADPHALRRLRRKGLVREGQPTPSMFSPLFANFVRQQSSPPEGVVISRSPRKVQIDGRRIENLTELEFEMLCYLYEHRDRVCTKDELIANVYRQQYDRTAGDMDDARLQMLISRLRAKIEPDCGQPRYIVTVRGEGYRFVDSRP